MPSIRIEGGLLSTQIVVKALCGHIRICELWKHRQISICLSLGYQVFMYSLVSLFPSPFIKCAKERKVLVS